MTDAIHQAADKLESLFAATLRSIGDAVIATDTAGRVVLMNPAAERLTGWTETEARDGDVDDVFRISAEQTRGAVESHVARVLREGQTAGLANHTLLTARDGTDRPIAGSVAPIRDARGEIAGVVLVFRDQTAERRATEALRQSEQRMQAERDHVKALMEATPAATFVVDDRGEIVEANPAAERAFGRDLSVSARLRFGDFVGCVHRHEDPQGCGSGPRCAICEMYETIKTGLAGRAVHRKEVAAEVEHDGAVEQRWFVVRAEPLVRDEGPTAVVTVSDITELRREQQAREQLQASLAQSDRLASMGMMAAGVAHEINNPLSYVLFNVESLSEDVPRHADGVRRCREALTARIGATALAEVLGADSAVLDPRVFEDVASRLREAAEGARRIKRIARGLGTFSRADSSELTPVNLQACIEHALNMAFNEIKYRARVIKDFRPVPPVLASDGKLAQVFLNLLVNAAHAIDEGHVDHNEIRVRTWVEGERVCVEVCDTGKGISPENQRRVFEPFFTTKGVGAGTGLGLWISRNIVTGFGGTIGFSSEPGKGTRFRLDLPALPPSWGTTNVVTGEKAPEQAGVRGRILVIDDEAGICKALQRMLGREHEVVAVSSGEEARELLGTDRRFDLVFCDLMMPRLSGMELHAWLVEVDPELAAQVVFITGGAFTPGASEYLGKTQNLRLEKPFETTNIERIADELVRAARAKRQG
jgi:PAS domain S-box-containing protein